MGGHVAQQSQAKQDPVESWMSWLVCLTAGLLFFYEFIQMNMFNVISVGFMKSFHIHPGTMGLLDSFYFIANVLFLLPAGYVLDRFPIRRVLLTSVFLCAIGTGAIALVDTLWLSMMFRFLTGVGSAFCFLSCIRLASHWFPPKRIGLVIGVIVTEAMLGGVVSQTPLTYLAQNYGWRHALLFDAAFGALIWLAIFLVVRDYPEGADCRGIKVGDQGADVQSYKEGFKLAFANSYNWLMGIFTAVLNFPMNVLGGIWGISYLTARFGLTAVDASLITSMLFFGMMVGSPLAGYISDVSEKRSLAMIGGSVLLIVLLLLLIGVTHWGHWSLMTLCFFIGLASGIQVVGYPAVAERAHPEVIAMSVSIVNISVIAGGGLIKPLFGKLMHWHQIAVGHSGEPLVFADYRSAMWLLPACACIAIFSVLISQRKRS